MFIFIIHLPFRCKLLKSHLEKLEQFDKTLLTVTQMSENFLSSLRSSSYVDISDIEAGVTKLKVRNQTFAVNNDVFKSFFCCIRTVKISWFVVIVVGNCINVSN